MAEAQFDLGSIFSDGKFIAKNEAESLRYYLMAAIQGYGEAQFNLGFTYGWGRGVPVDPVQAYKWFALSASRPGRHDIQTAIENRDHAAARLTSAQLREAQQWVASWQPAG